MKKERNNDIILTTILNKMLEKHDVDVSFVMKNQEIEGQLWYNYYTMTSKEFNEWKKWVMNYFKTTYIPKFNREREFDSINLMWGLKIREDDNTIE
jgi:hypothetical protein